MCLTQYLKLIGYLLSIVGILAVALATIGIWLGKYFGLGAEITKVFSALSFAAMALIVGFGMLCFWLSDRAGGKDE